MLRLLREGAKTHRHFHKEKSLKKAEISEKTARHHMRRDEARVNVPHVIKPNSCGVSGINGEYGSFLYWEGSASMKGELGEIFGVGYRAVIFFGLLLPLL